MKIDVNIHQAGSDKKIYQQVVRRVRLALSRFGASINSITIHLTDINGFKGGADKKCVVTVRLLSAGDVIVQGYSSDCFLALNHCLSRAGRTISRRIEQKRENLIRMNRRKGTSSVEDYDYSRSSREDADNT